jgi:putative (di)nucleoside polyphosphate hydrolase
MTLRENELALYRPAVGIMLLNHEGRVFVGRRIDMPAGLAAWQMPQGGIDPGETPREAALRELEEEVGTAQAEILSESRAWLHYEVPVEIAGRMWGGRYRGQRQKWFAMRFTGDDADIDPAATVHPEFDAWQWVPPERLPELIVPFKRQLYLDVLAEFNEHCRLRPNRSKSPNPGPSP